MTSKQWSHYIKRNEAEALTRRDLQYDVLKHIFSDTHTVFTHPTDTERKVSFKELYVAYISGSPKASKALKEKMKESALFMEDFAMLALLCNVGRIPSTMSFFLEMKTAIRNYHPVVALQRTNGSLQDAPRIKSILKTALLPVEARLAPSVPADILSRASEGKLPPTSVCNLLFVLAYHSTHVGKAHFSDELQFMDIFLPVDVSSESRARAFLWLCYHYLESSAIDLDDYKKDGSAGNPFCDPERPGKAPSFVHLSPEEAALENVDPEAEKSMAEKLIADRKRFILVYSGKLKEKAQAADEETSVNSDTKAKSKQSSPAKVSKENRATLEKLHQDTLQEQDHSAISDNLDGRDSYSSSYSIQPEPVRYSPYKPPPLLSTKISQRSQRPVKRPRRTMLQHAWHIITTSDPLLDSDEERGTEDDRLDYIQRLNVVCRLRGKEPTPEPERRAIEKRAYLHRPT